MTAETPEIPYRRIGTILVEWRLISEEELERALVEQEETGRLLGEILVTSYGISRVDLADALAEQWQEANRAATTALEQRGSQPSEGVGDSPSETLAEADLRVLLDEAEAARAELSVRTEELSRRLATLETLVVGVTEALDELRTAAAAEGREGRPPQLPTRRTRVRAGATRPGPRAV